jgi:hypothetical protein
MFFLFSRLQSPVLSSSALLTRLLRTNAPQSPLPIAPPIKALETPEQTAEARTWLSAFRNHSIPRNLVELSFSRSSGPGGQVERTPYTHTISSLPPPLVIQLLIKVGSRTLTRSIPKRVCDVHSTSSGSLNGHIAT